MPTTGDRVEARQKAAALLGAKCRDLPEEIDLLAREFTDRNEFARGWMALCTTMLRDLAEVMDQPPEEVAASYALDAANELEALRNMA